MARFIDLTQLNSPVESTCSLEEMEKIIFENRLQKGKFNINLF